MSEHSSMSLRKALNQNQSIDKELQKELHTLELKKKTSEKAFDHKRTQFLRRRLCLGRNTPTAYSQQCERKLGNEMSKLHDFGSSLPTGNLVDSFKTPMSETPSLSLKRQQFNGCKQHKLSLDSSHRYSNKREGKKRLVRFSSGKTIEKSHSWSDDLYATDDGHRLKDDICGRFYVSQIPDSTYNLKVPSLSARFLSRSDESLQDAGVEDKRKIKSDDYICDKDINHNNSNSLTVPLAYERLFRSDECLNTPPSTAACHNEMPSIERQHSFECKTQRKTLPKNIRTSTTGRSQTGHCCPGLKVPLVALQRKHSLNDALLSKRHHREASDGVIPGMTTKQNISLDVKLQQNQRSHSHSRERATKPNKDQTEPVTDNHLSLPVLPRQRSKSCENVSLLKEDHLRTRSHRGNDAILPSEQSIQLSRQPMPPLSAMSSRRKLCKDPRKVLSFGEATGEERRMCQERKQPTLRRSSSTPDLNDIGPEVEYLLMADVSVIMLMILMPGHDDDDENG